MFQRLQNKWKVGGWQLFLILCTFAIGGSLTGYVGRRLLNLLALEKGVWWIILYIILVTLLWPLAVLLVSFPFGQFNFFTRYLRKIGRRVGIGASPKEKGEASLVRVAVFASGAGSNAQKIIDHFRGDAKVKIALIVCNKPGAGVTDIAKKENIPLLMIERERFFRGDGYVSELQDRGIGFLVLAGFLWKIPDTLIAVYPRRIVNIHPALLPKYGGKGMYGDHVHAAVIAAGERESGITIHYVDGHYDNGDIIFQARCPVRNDDSVGELAKRIHGLEHLHFPAQLEKLLHGL